MPPAGLSIQATVAALRPRFQRCFQALLNEDPRGEGSAVLQVTIAPDGEVRTVTVARSDGLPDKTLACLQRAFAGIHTQALPEEALVNVPVRFVQGGRADGGAPDASP